MISCKKSVVHVPIRRIFVADLSWWSSIFLIFRSTLLSVSHSCSHEMLFMMQSSSLKPLICHISVSICSNLESTQSHGRLFPQMLKLSQMNMFTYLRYWRVLEVSNWAKPWYECKHNQNYWTHNGYRGYGLSAASLIDNNRILNSSSFRGYYRHEQERENLSKENIVHEKIIFGFRTFSLDENLCNGEHITELCERWFLERNNGKISPTLSWILQENHILWLL